MLGAVPTCSACVGLANRLCPEEKPSSPSSAVVIKIKPDLPEGGAESDEVKYMYVFIYINKCILYKIWTILNTLNEILNI